MAELHLCFKSPAFFNLLEITCLIFLYPFWVSPESRGGRRWHEEKSVFFPQSVLSCFVTVNGGYKMDKKIASGFSFFLFCGCFWFLVPPCFLWGGIKLQLCPFHITHNYGCLHRAWGGGSFHSCPPFLVTFIERKEGVQTRQLLLEKTFQLFCKGGHISYGLRELWS